ncbi:hypothetical protein Tco_1185466 [Tanacetum coccineum]
MKYSIEDIHEDATDGIFTHSSYDDEGAVADFTNLETIVNVSPIPTSRVHPSHPSTLILGDPTSAVQTRSTDFLTVYLLCFLSNIDPRRFRSFEVESWVMPMKEESVCRFEIQKVWILVDLPYGKKAIGTKWVYRNKKDERGVVVYCKKKYMCISPPGSKILRSPQKVYKVLKLLFMDYIKLQELVQVYVDDIIFGSTKKSWCDEFEALMKSRFQMSSMGELTFFLGLQTASTPIETQKPLVKDEEASDVDVHHYRSMIGSLMYVTASRPDIMFASVLVSRFQVNPKTSHMCAVNSQQTASPTIFLLNQSTI